MRDNGHLRSKASGQGSADVKDWTGRGVPSH